MRLVWMAAAAALLGCVAQPQGMPVGAAIPTQPRNQAALPPAWGVTELVVRSFVAQGGTTQEVGGARCTASSPYSTGSFTTPARLSLPDLGPQTPVVQVSCSDGGRKAAAEARAELRQNNGLAGWPAVGVAVGTGGGVGVSFGGFWNGGWGGASGPAVQQAVYPELRLLLQ